jgi:hypothetical protein
VACWGDKWRPTARMVQCRGDGQLSGLLWVGAENLRRRAGGDRDEARQQPASFDMTADEKSLRMFSFH